MGWALGRGRFICIPCEAQELLVCACLRKHSQACQGGTTQFSVRQNELMLDEYVIADSNMDALPSRGMSQAKCPISLLALWTFLALWHPSRVDAAGSLCEYSSRCGYIGVRTRIMARSKSRQVALLVSS